MRVRAGAGPRVGAPPVSRQCNKYPEVLNRKQIADGRTDGRERERGRRRDSNGDMEWGWGAGRRWEEREREREESAHRSGRVGRCHGTDMIPRREVYANARRNT